MTAARRIALCLSLGLPVLAAAPAAAAEPVRTLVVGDSLAVGMRPSFPPLVPGRALTFDVRSGRTTPQGLTALRTQVRASKPRAVVVSLGTNDGPSAARFADRIRRVLAATPSSACVVWPTIVRPPRKGEEAGLNRALRQAAARTSRLVLVDWVRAVRTGQVRLPDALHPDAEGYARRSRLVAAALRNPACAQPAPAADVAGDPASGGTSAP